MPNIGDRVKSDLVGYQDRCIRIWVACPNCGFERWVRERGDKGRSPTRKPNDVLCVRCSAIKRDLVGEKNHRWNGGIRHAGGYNYVSVKKDHLFIEMAGKPTRVHGRDYYDIAEHRLVMAQHLGRPLKSWELVHHINGIKDDNRIENLELIFPSRNHLSSIFLQREISALKQRVTLLEAENVLLKSLMNGSRDSLPAEKQIYEDYNTPDSIYNTEGIVRTPSNRGQIELTNS